MPGEIVSESWGSTQIQVVRFRYTWTINNFNFYCNAMGSKIASPSFSNTEFPFELIWHLEINPNGWYLDDSNVSCMSLYLHLDSFKLISIPTNFKLSILNDKSEEVYKFEDNKRFWNWKEKFHGNNSFIEKSKLLNEKTELFPDDKLTIRCDITALVGSSNFSEKFKPLSMKHPVAEDLEFLLKNPSYFSDVTLISEEKEFQAHKAILAARSSIFKDILLETREDDRFEIKDVNCKVLDKMLQYIYTDQVSDLDKSSSDLLIAAEQYSLDGLKARCVNSMCSNITVENACKFLILGDRYHQAELKKQTKCYICARAQDVVKTLEWKSMRETHPHLVTELFCGMVDSLISCTKPILTSSCNVEDTIFTKSIMPTITPENINTAKALFTMPASSLSWFSTKSQKPATVVTSKASENTSSTFSFASHIPELKCEPVKSLFASTPSSLNQISDVKPKSDESSAKSLSSSFTTTSVKHERFQMSPSMDLKSVTDLPGIEVAYASRLTEAGFDTACKVLKKFLELNKDRSDFEAWLRDTCGANVGWGPYCSEFFADWCNMNGY